jgi:signal transduction histidine kinase
MDKLFLRVYLHLFAAMLLFGLLFKLIISPYADARLKQNIEETFSQPVGLAVALLAEHYATHRDFCVLERLADVPRGDIALLSEHEIPLRGAERARLDRGQMVRTGKPFSPLLFIRIPGTPRILRMGPLGMVFPLSGWRGSLAFLLGMGALLLGAFLLLRPIRRRITALSRAAVALGRGELGTRTEVGAADAIGALAQSFNGMAEEIQRLVTAREELLNMTSHELRTPIQRLHFSLERLRTIDDPEKAAAACERMERDLLELDALIEELLTYARLEDRNTSVRGESELGSLCSELCETLPHLAASRSLVFSETTCELPPVAVEPRLVRRAVSNLLVNALRHAHSRVELKLQKEGSLIHVFVDDDGPGVPLAERAQIFKPFFRRDDPCTQNSRGSGLGLAIVRRIAERSGGQVSVDAAPLGGARFRLSLPAISH